MVIMKIEHGPWANEFEPTGEVRRASVGEYILITPSRTVKEVTVPTTNMYIIMKKKNKKFKTPKHLKGKGCTLSCNTFGNIFIHYNGDSLCIGNTKGIFDTGKLIGFETLPDLEPREEMHL